MGYRRFPTYEIQNLDVTGLRLLSRLMLRDTRVTQLLMNSSCQLHLSICELHEDTMPHYRDPLTAPRNMADHIKVVEPLLIQNKSVSRQMAGLFGTLPRLKAFDLKLAKA